MQINEEASAKSEEDLARERQRNQSKQEKLFDAELQELIKESLQENVTGAQSKPIKFVRERVDIEKEEPETTQNSDKKGSL